MLREAVASFLLNMAVFLPIRGDGMYFRQPVYPYPSQSFPLQHDMSRNQTNRMTLEGEGRVTVTPDLAKINIGIATESPNVQQAQQENTRTSNQIIDALRRIGIHENDIKTASYSVFPRYDYVEGKSILRGYEVEHLFEVTIRDLTKTGLVYDEAIKNGANRSGAIQFLVSNPEHFYQEALIKAMNNAENKAAVLAKTIGATLHPIPVKITERNFQQGPSPRPFMQTAGISTEGPPPIQEGRYTIIANVIVVYSYGNS